MAKFTLEEPITSRPVRVMNVRGLLSAAVHLTDHGEKTLCGLLPVHGSFVDALHERQWWKPAEPSCRKCVAAVDSKARVKREFR